MKKVLIITYYWPPAGGPGVQRWLKFVKYLPEYGIEPVVFIPENANYPILDKDLVREVSQDLEVLKLPITEPYKWANYFSKKNTKSISSGIIRPEKKQRLTERFLLYVRGNFFIPDARVGWVEPSITFLSEYLKNNTIETVITTGPPHSLHLIGSQLKKTFKMQWIADFRDPWTTIGYHKKLKLTEKAASKHKTLESKVLNEADRILTTSYTTKKEFEQLTPKPITVITNGYDTDKNLKPSLDKKFSISHIGTILSDRNPRILWKALKELVKENQQFRNDFQLKLVGNVSSEILETIKEFGLEKYVHTTGYVTHSEALKLQRSSQMLLLLEIDSFETIGIIPGKLFEYMAAERPIIALGPEGSDIAKILTETNTGKFFDYTEKESVKNYISNSYDNYLRKTLNVFGIGLQYYSRKKLTEKLANLIKENTQHKETNSDKYSQRS